VLIKIYSSLNNEEGGVCCVVGKKNQDMLTLTLT